MKVFETERLILRYINTSDIDNLLEIFSDPEAMRFLPEVKGQKETEEWITQVQESYQDHGFGPWAVVLKDSSEFAGYCGLCIQKDVCGRDEIEILYGFVRRLWNHGYATEAAIGTYQYATQVLRQKRLISLIDPKNGRSAKVAEKVGMQKERETIRWNKCILVYSID